MRGQSPLVLRAQPAMPSHHTGPLSRPDSRIRTEIPAEFRWDFSPIFADWSAWEAALQAMDARMQAYAALKGTLAGGAAALLDACLQQDEIGKLQFLTYRYAQLQRDVDTRDQDIAARLQRVSAMFANFAAATAWFTPELLALPEATVRAWIDETPALAPYRFTLLDLFRQQAHVLDENGERLLALSGRSTGAAAAAYGELTTSDIHFPTIVTSEGESVELTPGRYMALLQTATAQADRAQAAQAHLATYGAHAHTYAALYRGVLQRDWFLAQARRFGSTLEAALDDNAIPVAVVETLVQTARAGTAPLQRYARLRRRLLGLDSYHPYDGFVPIFRDESRYPYELARELAQASVAPLGPAYGERYRQFVAGGRIDVYENEGKVSGAYSANVYGVGPYLLLNYNDTMDAMFTFAHEAGHAMHSVLSNESQPYATSSYTIFVAEVASTMNERLLLEHLLSRTTDARERFLLLQHAVDQIVSTFYTQVMFADFELQAHRRVERDEPITTEALNDLYLSVLTHYYGDAVTVDEFYRWTWARIGHFFKSPYYVYQYATCFASSARLFDALTRGSEADRDAALQRYLTLLSSGGNDHPMRQLQQAGVDLTDPATVQALVDELDHLLDRMEAEAARVGADIAAESHPA